MTSFLIRFFDPSTASADPLGRTLASILAFTNAELEYHHDYVQILFPLPEGSPINPMAPVITKEVYVTFHERLELRLSLINALRRMLAFYGFEIQEAEEEGDRGDDVKVVKASNFEKQARNWMRRFNHNHLRITRIIRSLRVLGLEDYAQAFYDALQADEITRVVSGSSQMYWRRAMERPLYLAPSDEEGAEGLKWLRQLEKSAG